MDLNIIQERMIEKIGFLSLHPYHKRRDTNELTDKELALVSHDDTEPLTKYYSVRLNNKPAGFVGYTEKLGRKWLQVAINPNFRGLRLAGRAENELMRKEGIKKAWAAIKSDNYSSIRAHLKNGFRFMTKEERKVNPVSNGLVLVKETV